MELAKEIEIFFSSDIKLCKEILDNKEKFTQQAKKIFNVVDINKDGLIDFPEFANLIKEIEKKSCKSPEEMEKFEKNYLTEDKIKTTFSEFDTNKDGRIDFPEFQEIFRDLMEANLIAQGEN